MMFIDLNRFRLYNIYLFINDMNHFGLQRNKFNIYFKNVLKYCIIEKTENSNVIQDCFKKLNFSQILELLGGVRLGY